MSRLLIAFLLVCLSTLGQAAELKVLTAGAFKPVLMALKPDFEKKTGHTLVIDNDTAGALQKRIAGGEVFDVVISSPSTLKALQASHLSSQHLPVGVARVAIGVAVRRGEPLPDISSVQAFRKMLSDARRIALIDPASGGSSGIYLAGLFEQWGLAASLRDKSVLVMGGLVAQKLVDGLADVALHQISEILAVPEAVLVGPIPAEIQNYTSYAAAVSSRTGQLQAALVLQAALQSPEIRAILQAKGMEPAPSIP